MGYFMSINSWNIDHSKFALKTMGRRPKSDINMDGSIGEDFTSLERMAAMDV